MIGKMDVPGVIPSRCGGFDAAGANLDLPPEGVRVLVVEAFQQLVLKADVAEFAPQNDVETVRSMLQGVMAAKLFN